MSNTKRPSLRDSLLGKPVMGYEGKYWHTREGDETPAGHMLSGTGIKIPRTLHIPTGSDCSYIKVYLTLIGGRKIEVWQKHEDLK